MKFLVKIPEKKNINFKAWRKLIKDIDKSKKGGFAFLGNFLTPGKEVELEANALILLFDEGENKAQLARLMKISADGKLVDVAASAQSNWSAEFIKLAEKELGKKEGTTLSLLPDEAFNKPQKPKPEAQKLKNVPPVPYDKTIRDFPKLNDLENKVVSQILTLPVESREKIVQSIFLATTKEAFDEAQKLGKPKQEAPSMS